MHKGWKLKTDWRYASLLILVTLWCLGIFFVPLFKQLEWGIAYTLLNYMYSLVCHQKAERSFFFLGEQLPVCARCLALYVSFLIGTIVLPFLKIKFPVGRKWLLIGLTPLAIDGITQLTGLRESNNILRLITGVFLGCILTLYIVPGWIEFVKVLESYKKKK
ncbi:DUF2085 domain-containing protein [Nanoarchaeota archaeon]